ncbi:DUF4942 domain-containing protein [Cereibacter sphaeroides]|uniref:DUF4942 domain-containing protein n=1 Tax=Cereibacter sphaeroides TaxID=1063 RepID=UPI001F3AE9DD|nr:DUF4942 domain-containing protein [Cereibacter sphaeroides]MCE6959563.1 DUF4942 domain-containing protein [Cereibacter sphaeroides]MCE6974577.1 DUF4942 domain-containing protein [Cereibacter sphaeroides]
MDIRIMDTEGDTAGNGLPALRSQADRIVAQRDAAIAKATEAAGLLVQAYGLMREAMASAGLACDGRTSIFAHHGSGGEAAILFNDRFDAGHAVEHFRRGVDANVWANLMQVTGLRDLMDREEAERFDRSLADEVPAVTLENLNATFERLVGESRMIFERGVANVFSRLDPRFKSHDAFSVGSRIILTYVFDSHGYLSGGRYGREMLMDVDRVLRVLDPTAHRVPLVQGIEASRRGHGPRQGCHEDRHVKVRTFANGNAHLWLSPEATRAVNGILASFYGDTLADAAPEDMDGETFAGLRANLPARDLAFYPTPDAAVAEALQGVWFEPGMRVLEPSAGSGAFVRALLEKGVEVDAIEIHPSRVAQLRVLEGPRCRVIAANFLGHPVNPVYDRVVMNPPFSGTEWMKHVRHAFDFLKPGGKLVAILPASAEVNETAQHLAFRRWAEKEGAGRYYDRMWRDLPPESFASVGTRINTVVLTLVRK